MPRAANGPYSQAHSTLTRAKRQISPVQLPAPSSEHQHYTSLRRTTRSTAPPTTPLKGADQSAMSTSASTKRTVKALDISKYAYKPSPSTPPRKRIKVEVTTPVKQEDEDEDGRVQGRTPPSAKKKPLPLLALEKPHPPPRRWEEQYRLIEHMRKGIVAPVDTMGCERPRTTVIDPKTIRFHILISLMLSSQTKDAVTSEAVTILHSTLPGGLTAESLASAPREMVEGCINKVGFWRRKAEYIQAAAEELLKRDGEEKGDVPDTLEGLCALKGVGPKMAFLALQCAWDINAGIGVDVHVHRITNRLRWHKPPTTTPEQTRLNLQSWLPPSLHKGINPMLVGFGQVICLPVGPRCDLCLLGKKGICPSRVVKVNSEGRKEVVITYTDVEEGGKLEVKYEEGLERIDDPDPDPDPAPDPEIGSDERPGGGGVKKERDEGVDSLSEDPGMRRVEEVLEVLDRVDGVDGIGEVGTRVKREMDW